MGRLDVWYAHWIAEAPRPMGQDLAATVIKRFQRTVDKAESKDRLKAKAKLTRVVDGELRFVSDPPLLVPVGELFPSRTAETSDRRSHEALRAYRRPSSATDATCSRATGSSSWPARSSVSAASAPAAGSRSWSAATTTTRSSCRSRKPKPRSSSRTSARAGSRTTASASSKASGSMQTASDIFLGWERIDGDDDQPHDYYIRQLWDWKASAESTP